MPARRRPAAERRRDFDVVRLPYTPAQARWEAARCLGCHDAPCQDGCHADVDVRGFIRHLQLDDVGGAADIIRQTNVLGGSCARVCDASGLCMLACTRADLDGPVDIAGLEEFAIETARASGLRPLPQGPVSGHTVAVLGAGPAGLSAAAELRRRGHGVVLYDARPEPGGALVWGIPPYRLPRELVQAEMESIVEAGVELRLGQAFDSLDSLLDNFDAVVLAVGLALSARLGVDGEDLGGVIPAAALLDGSFDEVGPLPVVVGGGTVAVDSATTARRLAGSKGRVTLIYRRAAQHMPGSRAELLAAEEEGVVLRPLTVVDRILGDADGNVEMVRCRTAELGEPDDTGRPTPMEISGSLFDLPATSVIVAAGEAADLDLLVGAGLSDEEPRGDGYGRTGVKGVYVAGDAVGGPRSVGWSVSSGRLVAQAIDEDLDRESGSEEPFPVLGHEVDLSIEFARKTLPNPFLLSASPATDDMDMVRAALRAGWAGVVLRTTTAEGVEIVRKHPSIAPIGEGSRMISALGNIDLISAHHVEVVAERVAALREEFPDRLVAASMTAEDREGWQKLAKRLVAAGADALECSVSSPQGTLGSQPGAMVGQDAKQVRTITRWVKDAAGDTPVYVKLTPQVADIGEIARAVVAGGGDGVCAANAVPALAGVDATSAEPLPSVGGRSTYSGLTGPAIFPMSLRAVAESARAGELEISGSGGVSSWRDALSMMMMGATTVQVCTAVMHFGFDLIDGLTSGLARYVEALDLEGGLGDLVGRARDAVTVHGDLAQPGAVRAKIDHGSCIACGRCYITCRDGAHRAIDWDDEERAPAVSLERCVGCGLCAGVCPSDSISFMILGT